MAGGHLQLSARRGIPSIRLYRVAMNGGIETIDMSRKAGYFARTLHRKTGKSAFFLPVQVHFGRRVQNSNELSAECVRFNFRPDCCAAGALASAAFFLLLVGLSLAGFAGHLERAIYAECEKLIRRHQKYAHETAKELDAVTKLSCDS
jgi:hypothetical protein